MPLVICLCSYISLAFEYSTLGDPDESAKPFGRLKFLIFLLDYVKGIPDISRT